MRPPLRHCAILQCIPQGTPTCNSFALEQPETSFPAAAQYEAINAAIRYKKVKLNQHAAAGRPG
jgi:hypothetical protein